MSDAGYKAAQEYLRGTVRRWGRGRTILVGVLGALVMLAVGVISAAALVGFSPLSTSNTPANTNTASNTPSNTNAGASHVTPPVNDVTAVVPEGATLSAAATPAEMNFACALKRNGMMRYVTNLNKCKKSEEKVTIKPGPEVLTCVKPDGSVLKVANCKPRHTPLTLPPTSRTVYFCAANSTGLLRFVSGPSQCTRKEFAVFVSQTNHVPVAADQSVSTNEDSAKSITLTASDEDRDTLTFVIVSGPFHGTLSGTAPDVTYTPDGDFSGSDSFSFEARDGKGGADTATVSMTVTAVNDSPTDVALSNASVDENEASGTTVGKFSTTDPDSGDTHTYTLASGAGDDDNGSFQIMDGTLKTAAGFDFETKDSYTIRVKTDDGHGGTFEKQFTISITQANDTPTDITLSNSSVDENQPAGTNVGTLSSIDQDSGDTFTYTLVTGTGDTDNAKFQISGSALQTNETFDFETKSSYTIRVKSDDGHGGTFEKQLTISVSNTNDAPTNLVLSNNTVAENQPSGTNVGTLSADDGDGDTLSFAFATGTGDTDNGSFQISGSTLQTNAQFDFEAKDTYTIRLKADDGKGGTFEESFTITLNNANDAPTDISLSSSSVAENQPSATNVGTFSSTDQDAGDTHTYTLVSGAGSDDNSSFTISGSALQTNAQFDFETKDSYTIRIKSDDGKGGTFEKQLTISITNANDQPSDISLSKDDVGENQSTGTDVGTLSTTDQDSADAVTYELVSGMGDTDNGSFQISGSTLQTATTLNFEDGATRSVRVRTTDGTGATFEKSFTITVNDLNDAPTNLALSNNTVEENQSSGANVGTLSADDADSDTLSFTFATGTGDTDNGSFQISGNTLQTNEAFDFETKDTYTIRVKADDGNGGTVEEQFTILVSDINDQPTDISLSNSSVDENQRSGTPVGTLSSADQDTTDSHTYTLVSGDGDDDNGSFQISGDTLQTNATFDFEVKDSYTIRIKTDDGNGGTVEKVLTISITNANDAPTDISLSNSSVIEHQPSATPVGTLSSIDRDAGDTFTYSLVTGSGDTNNASFQISGSELQTNADLATGTYSVRVRTDDGNGGTFEKQFTITVVPANLAPTDISLSNDDVDENQPSGTDVGTLSTTDPDSGDHTYSLVTGTGDTDNASFQISGSTLQTATTLNFEDGATRSVRIKTDDGKGGTFEKQFTITVNNANDAPTDISLSSSSVAENQPSATNVGTFSSTDQDAGDTHTYTLVSGDGSTDNGSFQISGDTLQTNAQFDFETKDSYTIRIRSDDSHGGTFDKQFTISITNANDAPTDISLSPSSVDENQPSGTTVGRFSSTDQEAGDTHTYTLVSGAGSDDNSSFQISGDTLQTNAQFDFETKDSYTIRVKTDDGQGGTFEKQLTISVTNTNDAPTDIALSSSSVAENQPSGATVGTLSTTDEDTRDTHTYTLVSGAGDTDNSSFQISGSTLQTNARFDFETKDSYTIRLKADDGNGGTFEKSFTISITNANDAPTDIALSKSDIDENRPSGTAVGTFSTTDQDAGDTHTYALVSGTGSTDNGQFQIVGGELRTNASFNFEVKNSYSILIRTTDNGSPTQSFEEAFTITINDVNDPPVATADSYSGAIGNTLASLGTSPSGPNVALTGNVLTNNDTDEDRPAQPLRAVSETVTSTGGGTATINSDGSFTFLPGVGDKNQNDTFTYQITDGTATASGTVTVGIANALVWYVNNGSGACTSNCDGRSSSPLTSLSGVNAAGGTGDSDGSGDILFLYQGSGNYTGGLPLEANQQLLGQPNGLTVNNGASDVTLVSPSGTRPTITNSSGNAITLGTGNTIRSVIAGNASASAISGSNFGTLTVADTGINSNGQALNLTTGTLAGSGFTGISSSGGTNNVLLSSVGTGGSTFALGSGSLSGASSDAFRVVGSGSFSYSGNVSQANSGAALVSVSGGHNGTLTFDTGTLSATGGSGLQFDNADGTYNFNGTTTLNGGDAGIDILNGSTGTFSFGSGTTITNPSGTGFNLSGATASNATVTYSGNISKNNAGPAINIDNHDANTITFQTGTLSSTGTSSGIRVQNSNGGTINFNQPTKTLNTGTNTAVALSTNTGGTMNFGNGGLNINTTSGAGFSATGGGTVTVQGSGNTIDAVSAPALTVANTTIGSSNLTFQRISSGNATAAADPANGIVLNNTGTAAGNGGLVVTGTGGTCTAATPTCTGGTIQTLVGGDDSSFTPVGTGIVLTSTREPSLTSMRVRNASNYGIRGNQVTNLSLANSLVDGTNGTNEASPFSDGSISFDTILGTNSITGSEISGGWQRNIRVDHAAGVGGGTMTLTITGNNIHDTVGTAPDDGVFVEAENNDNYTVNVANNTLKNHGGDHVNVTMINNATINVSITGNTLENTETPVRLGGGIFVFGASWNGTGTYTVSNNTILRNRQGGAIHMNKGSGTGTLSGSVTNNTIGTSGVNKSGSIEASGIVIGARGASGTHTTLVEDNNIFGWNDRAIILENGEGSPTLNATVRGNTADTFDPVNGLHGLHADLGILSGDAGSVCLDVGGDLTADRNHLTLAGNEAQGGADIRVRRASAVNLRMPGYAGGSDDDAAVTSYLSGRNDVTSLLVSSPGTGTYSGGGACPQP
jgi:hypothetical protein